MPYTVWEHGSNKRPFWLYELNADGWKARDSIKANTPYILSMPNNEERYEASYNITGKILFAGSDVQVMASDNLKNGQYGNKRLVANYQNQDANGSIYALNVSNEWYQNTETEAEGSTFIRALRSVHPFEAYMTLEGSSAAQRAIPIFEDEKTTKISEAGILRNGENEEWYTIDGQKLQKRPATKGLYILNRQKIIIK